MACLLVYFAIHTRLVTEQILKPLYLCQGLLLGTALLFYCSIAQWLCDAFIWYNQNCTVFPSPKAILMTDDLFWSFLQFTVFQDEWLYPAFLFVTDGTQLTLGTWVNSLNLPKDHQLVHTNTQKNSFLNFLHNSGRNIHLQLPTQYAIFSWYKYFFFFQIIWLQLLRWRFTL